MQLLQDRQQASALMDAMGSEQFSWSARATRRRSWQGDRRDHGRGQVWVIRGLSDRYTATLLNGAEVPSADPYRRGSIDLFPSDMIERVVVANVYARLPGGFAGAPPTS